MKMFEDMADEIFIAGGLTKALYPKLWAECVGILSMQMARLSSAQALGDITSHTRVELFNAQKAALVQDVKDITSGESEYRE